MALNLGFESVYMFSPILFYFLQILTIRKTILTLLSTNPTKWSNTLKEFVGKLPTNCLSVFNHYVGLALKGLNLWLPLPRTEKYGKMLIKFHCPEMKLLLEYKYV